MSKKGRITFSLFGAILIKIPLLLRRGKRGPEKWIRREAKTPSLTILVILGPKNRHLYVFAPFTNTQNSALANYPKLITISTPTNHTSREKNGWSN